MSSYVLSGKNQRQIFQNLNSFHINVTVVNLRLRAACGLMSTKDRSEQGTRFSVLEHVHSSEDDRQAAIGGDTINCRPPILPRMGEGIGYLQRVVDTAPNHSGYEPGQGHRGAPQQVRYSDIYCQMSCLSWSGWVNNCKQQAH